VLAAGDEPHFELLEIEHRRSLPFRYLWCNV
jgi:hypothetical protein